jgi:hypothetical protein
VQTDKLRQENEKTANRTNGTFGFCRNKPNAEKPKEPFFANAPTEKLTLD